jgi:hypothetical protein
MIMAAQTMLKQAFVIPLAIVKQLKTNQNRIITKEKTPHLKKKPYF